MEASKRALLDLVGIFWGAVGLMTFFGPAALDPAALNWWRSGGLPVAASVAAAAVVGLGLLARRRGTRCPRRLSWWLVAPTSLVALPAVFPSCYIAAAWLHEADMLTASGNLFVVMLPTVVLVNVVFWAARRTEKTSAG